MENMAMMNFLDKFKTIKQHDSRHSFSDFYYTFDLDDFYTDGMVHLIMTGKRSAKNSNFLILLSRCVSVYADNTDDYSHLAAGDLNKALHDYEKRHDLHVTNENLARYAGYNPSKIGSALKGRGRFIPDVWDSLSLDLLPLRRDKNSFVENVAALQELKRRLMRAEIGDGTQILTPIEVAKAANLPVDIVEHLDKACHDADTYKEVYGKLVSVQQRYADSLR